MTPQTVQQIQNRIARGARGAIVRRQDDVVRKSLADEPAVKLNCFDGSRRSCLMVLRQPANLRKGRVRSQRCQPEQKRSQDGLGKSDSHDSRNIVRYYYPGSSVEQYCSTAMMLAAYRK